MSTISKTQLDSFLKDFKLTSTDSSTDVGKSDVKRKALAHYIKASSEEEYELLGYKQESATVESNYESDVVTDVTGASYNDIMNKAETINLSEYKFNPTKTKFLENAIKMKLSDQEAEMQNYTILTVYGFLRDTSGKCLAVEESGCSVVLDNLGGQGFTHSDVNITLSGIKTYGTVDEIVPVPTFVEYSPV